MKTYRPGLVPQNPAELPGFLRSEFQAIQRAANASEPFAQLNELHAYPKKVFNGMVCLFDGVDCDPGSGAGLYAYVGGAWRFLG